MAAKRHAHAHATIVFDIEVNPLLLSRLEMDTLRTNVSQDFDELLQILGLPSQAIVHFKSMSPIDQSPTRILSGTVDGRSALLPLRWVYRIYESVVGESIRETLPASILATLGKLSLSHLDAFIRLACGELFKQAPANLFTLDTAAAYRKTLKDKVGDITLPDEYWLQDVLSPALNLRISIADSDKVAQVLRDGLAVDRSPMVIAEDLIAALRPSVVEIQLPRSYLKQLTLNKSELDLGNFANMRDGLFYELGIHCPAFTFVPIADLQPDSFRFKINHLVTLPMRGLRVDERLVNETPDRLDLLCIEGRAAVNPANHSFCAIVASKDTELAAQAGLTTWDPLEYLVLALSANLRAYAPCFVDQTEVEAQLKNLEWAFPRLVQDVRTCFSADVLTQALRQLVSEAISIRNLAQILEAMLNLDYDGSPYTVFDPAHKAWLRPDCNWFTTPSSLVTLARIQMDRTISYKYQQRDNTLVVYLLDPTIENLLANNQLIPPLKYLEQIAPLDKDRIMTAIRAEFDLLMTKTQDPVVLTTSTVRPVLRALIAREFPQVTVLSYQELALDMTIQPIAQISWN